MEAFVFIHPVGFSVSWVLNCKNLDEWLLTCPMDAWGVSAEWAKAAYEKVTKEHGKKPDKTVEKEK